MAEFTVPDDLKYAKTDEWFRVSGDEAEVGITDYAQDQLSDIVYVELPSVGDTFDAGDTFGVVESVKAAADLNMAVTCEVTAVNDALEDSPENVNSDPYGSWMVKVKITDAAGLDGLLDADAYRTFIAERE